MQNFNRIKRASKLVKRFNDVKSLEVEIAHTTIRNRMSFEIAEMINCDKI
jgi:hypothetical protein